MAGQIDEFLKNQQLFERYSSALELTNIVDEHDTASGQGHATPDPGSTAVKQGEWKQGVFTPGFWSCGVFGLGHDVVITCHECGHFIGHQGSCAMV